MSFDSGEYDGVGLAAAFQQRHLRPAIYEKHPFELQRRQLRRHRIIGSLTAACDIGHINDDDALFVVSSTCASKIQRRALPQELSNLCLGSTAATQASAATQRHANASTANQ